jgi:hypothetical protein
LENLHPFHGGGEMIAVCGFDGTTYAGLPSNSKPELRMLVEMSLLVQLLISLIKLVTIIFKSTKMSF